MTIKRDTVGDFWVAFACEVEQVSKIAETGQTAGIDFGLKTFLTFSDGAEVESPQFFRQGSQAIAKASRKVSGSVKDQCGELVQRDHNAALVIEHGRAVWIGVCGGGS